MPFFHLLIYPPPFLHCPSPPLVPQPPILSSSHPLPPNQVYLDQDEWTRRSILYTAGSGKFSSDKTILECAKVGVEGLGAWGWEGGSLTGDGWGIVAGGWGRGGC